MILNIRIKKKGSRSILAHAWMPPKTRGLAWQGRHRMHPLLEKSLSQEGLFPLCPSTRRFHMERNHLWCWAERGKSMANKIPKGRGINILKRKGKTLFLLITYPIFRLFCNVSFCFDLAWMKSLSLTFFGSVPDYKLLFAELYRT